MSAPAPTDAVPVDLRGPLPTGTTVLEASAGTGKTYAIAALAARYVAEGRVALPGLMLVTFGREATRELRERIRERFTQLVTDLGDPDRTGRAADALTAFLAAGDPAEVRARRDRLVHALAHFDAATIATTHQFCQEMLAGLGMVGDTDPEAEFVERIDDVVDEVVDDFFVRAFGGPTAEEPLFDHAVARTLGRAAVDDPEAAIAPERGEAADRAAGRRGDFARAVRAEVERRKRTRRLYTYDDMLVRLHAALTDPEHGDAARARLRSRFDVVLVDEFQDTDPIQWDILRTAFHGHTTLTVIGDPKQSIYAFRGADLVSYLRAREAAGTRATLDTNFRSDAGLLRALDVVLGGAALGDERITVAAVRAHHDRRRLTGAPDGHPLRLRVVPREGLPSWDGLPRVAAAREHIAADLAADVSRLLAADSRWDRGKGPEPLLPADVAVLVRTNAQAELVRGALATAGVPVVLAGGSSVFATPAATEWLTLLEAVEQPGRPQRARAAALSGFLGHTAAELDAEPDRVLSEVAALLRRWGGVLRDRGVAAFLEDVSTRTDLPTRVLGALGGERRLTDLRHIGQVLHAEAGAGGLGVVALVGWLRRRIREAAEGGGEAHPERSRRLESDADAVQVLTVHKCKGLEFPVVYVPFGWDRWVADEVEQVLCHAPDGRRVRAVGGRSDPSWDDHRAAAEREDAGEELRLLYVALTRAAGQVVAWWAPTANTRTAALHRLLLGRRGPGLEPEPALAVPPDERVWAELAAVAGDDVAVEAVEPPSRARRPEPWMPAASDGSAPVLRRFERRLDLAWRRSSYSSLTAAAHAAAPAPASDDPAGEPEEAVPEGAAGLDDEPGDDAAGPAADPVPEPEARGAAPSPLAGLPGGTAFGSLVHTVLETADTTADDLPAELTAVAADALESHPVADVDPATLAAALVPVVETPLALEGLRLRDLAPRDRLAELDFELPLDGGDGARGTATVTLSGVADLLRAHLPAEDPLRGYPDVLDGLGEAVLRGYLTGSIDAVLRTPAGRYVVVDYKTNWLGPQGPAGPEPLTLAHYAGPRLLEAMVRAHYPLQALLYAVALHRFLRWRLRDYDPARHLGGVRYLFLRGMGGADTPAVDGVPAGVFAWSPPAQLVAAVSRLLEGAGS